MRDSWVDAFAVPGPPASTDKPSLAEDARDALAVAVSMLHNVERTPENAATAAFMGALWQVVDAGISDGDDELVVALRDRHPDDRDPREIVVDAAMSAGLYRPGIVVRPSDRLLRRLGLADTIALAGTIAGMTAAEHVHLRHVLAAALTVDAVAPLPQVFASLRLTPGELRELTRRWVERTAPAEHQAAWRVLLRHGLPRDPGFGLAGGFSSDAVDPTTAIALDRDHLGVHDDVTMLATVIADKQTPMPLSIGLFGKWGSGKSTFMGLMRGQVEALATSGGGTYHRNIHQIGFNAWHYADTNLWASLGQEIFEQLAGPGNRNEPERAALESELASHLHARKELEAATARAKAETARLSAGIDAAAAASARSAAKLARAAAAAPTVKRELDAAFKRLGVSDEAEQGRRLAAELRGATSDYDRLRANLAWLVTPPTRSREGLSRTSSRRSARPRRRSRCCRPSSTRSSGASASSGATSPS